ncbi:hypothetical protein ACHAPJ_008993 [Fusarium lateritium]
MTTKLSETSLIDGVAAVELTAVDEKYAEEAGKRCRSNGATQYINSRETGHLQKLAADPWVDHDSLNALLPTLEDDDEVKLLIVGAGFGGLNFAIRFIQAGFKAQDIRLVDDAGGFGGT